MRAFNVVTGLLFACAAGTASADFAGQTIFGPLSPGSVVSGNTTGHADNNDGFTSGMHIFDIWDGGDDVWALDWPGGGDIVLTMTYNNALCDLDLFLYTPSNLDDSGNYSIINSGVENITEPGAAAGTYYIVIDSTPGAEGAYELSVGPVPAPGGLLGLGAGMIGCAIRRRR